MKTPNEMHKQGSLKIKTYKKKNSIKKIPDAI
jgi:hypothetical protein